MVLCCGCKTIEATDEDSGEPQPLTATTTKSRFQRLLFCETEERVKIKAFDPRGNLSDDTFNLYLKNLSPDDSNGGTGNIDENTVLCYGSGSQRVKTILNMYDLAAVFPTVQLQSQYPEAIVLLGVKHAIDDSVLQVVCFRFLVVSPQLDQNEVLSSLRIFIEFKSKILNPFLIKTHVLSASGEIIPAFQDIIGATKDVATKGLEVITDLGQHVAFIAPICAILRFALSTCTDVQSTKDGFLRVMDAFERYQPYLISSKLSLQTVILEQVEAFFTKTGFGMAQNVKDFQSALDIIWNSLDVAVKEQLLTDHQIIMDGLNDITKSLRMISDGVEAVSTKLDVLTEHVASISPMKQSDSTLLNSNPKLAEIPGTVPKPPESYITRDQETNKLMDALLNDSPTVSVSSTAVATGMGGIGKTTAASYLIHHKMEIREAFCDGVAWISLGQTKLERFNKLKTHYWSILQQVTAVMESPRFEGFDSEGEEVSMRMAFLLMDKVMRRKKILIVLDDVWFPDDVNWFRFGDSRAGKLLVTTRQPDLLKGEAGVCHVDIGILTEADSVELLKEISGACDPLKSDDLSHAKRIVNGCGCLPLAISSVGRLMRRDDRNIASPKTMAQLAAIVGTFVRHDVDQKQTLFDVFDLNFSVHIHGDDAVVLKRCFAAFAGAFTGKFESLISSNSKAFKSPFTHSEYRPWVPYKPTKMFIESIANHGVMGQEISPQRLDVDGILSKLLSLGILDRRFPVSLDSTAEFRVHHDMHQEYAEEVTRRSNPIENPLCHWKSRLGDAFLDLWDSTTDIGSSHMGYLVAWLPWYLIGARKIQRSYEVLRDKRFIQNRLKILGLEKGTMQCINDWGILTSDVLRRWEIEKEKPDYLRQIRHISDFHETAKFKKNMSPMVNLILHVLHYHQASTIAWVKLGIACSKWDDFLDWNVVSKLFRSQTFQADSPGYLISYLFHKEKVRELNYPYKRLIGELRKVDFIYDAIGVLGISFSESDTVDFEVVHFEKVSNGGPIVDFDIVCRIQVVLKGPMCTPYEGGKFLIEVAVPSGYPTIAPKLTFFTQIWHPNVCSKTGATCLIDYSEWSPALKIEHLLLKLHSLIIDPDENDPMDEDASEMYKTNKAEFERKAKEWTVLGKAYEPLTQVHRVAGYDSTDAIRDMIISAGHPLPNRIDPFENERRNFLLRRPIQSVDTIGHLVPSARGILPNRINPFERERRNRLLRRHSQS